MRCINRHDVGLFELMLNVASLYVLIYVNDTGPNVFNDMYIHNSARNVDRIIFAYIEQLTNGKMALVVENALVICSVFRSL